EISILGCFPFVLPSFRTISPDILTISLPFPGILPPYKVIGMANQDALPSIRVTLPSFQASRMGMPIKWLPIWLVYPLFSPMLRPWKMTRVYNRLKQMSFRTLWLSVRGKFPFVQVSRMGNPVELLSIQLTFPFGEVILPSGKVTHPSGRMRTSLSSLGLISPQMSSFSVKIFGLGTPLFHSEGMGPAA